MTRWGGAPLFGRWLFFFPVGQKTDLFLETISNVIYTSAVVVVAVRRGPLIKRLKWAREARGERRGRRYFTDERKTKLLDEKLRSSLHTDRRRRQSNII